MTKYPDVFEGLKEQVAYLGLLDRTPIRGAFEMSLVFISMALIYTILFNWQTSFSSLALGLFMCVVFTRAIFIIHDILHTQYFKSKKLSKNLSMFFVAIVGNSPSWWSANHHLQHHPFVNIIDKDLDINILDGLFINGNSNSVFLNRFLYYFGMFLVYPYFILMSYLFVIKKKKYVEFALMCTHWLVIWLPIFYFLSLAQAFSVLVTLYLSLSLWLGLGFAMNHLARETFTKEEADKLTKMELQMRVTRSLSPHWFNQWFFGGLNAHIEHHLFPTASRFNMLRIQEATMSFMQIQNIPYYIQTPYQAYKEIDEMIVKNSKNTNYKENKQWQ